MPKVSIIIPVYNSENFLEKCLDSIINQTFKNIEIICVNDGSKDNSLQLLQKYKNRDNRIIIIDKPNEGVSEARNDGIRKSTGEYITFVDADDWLEKDAIESLYNAIEYKKCDVVRSNYYINNSNNEVLGVGNLCGLENKLILTSQKDFVELVNNNLLNGNLLCYVWSLLIKRDIILKTSLFSKGIAYMEDSIFYNELMNAIDSIYFLDKPTYHYYNNSNSCTKSQEYYVRNIYSLSKAHKKLLEIIEEDKFENKNNRVNIITDKLGDKIVSCIFFMYLSSYKTKNELIELLIEIMEDENIYYIIKNTNLKRLPFHLSIPFKLILKRKYKILICFYDIRIIMRKIKLGIF